MALNAEFALATERYRVMMLDAVDCLSGDFPFAAVMLACCAIDHLAHGYHVDLGQKATEDDFKSVVRMLPGYNSERIAEAIYQYLRSGLVHEFRTGSRDPQMDDGVLISSEYEGAPIVDDNTVLVSVNDLVTKVRAQFEAFAAGATTSQRDRFVKRSFLYAAKPKLVTGATPSISDTEPFSRSISQKSVRTDTVPATGSGAGYYYAGKRAESVDDLLQNFEEAERKRAETGSPIRKPR
jgi:hypothetical protein